MAEYGSGLRAILFQDGTSGTVEYDSKGVHFRADGYYPMNVTWGFTASRIRHLIEEDRYLDEDEKRQAARYTEAQDALLARQETGETLRVFAAIHGPKDRSFLNQLAEDLRAFIYEDSIIARESLLATFRELSALPRAAEDQDGLSVLKDALSSLETMQEGEDSNTLSSATDAGIANPFPNEEELSQRELDARHPLSPVLPKDDPTELNPADTEELSAVPDMSQFEEGDIVTLSGTDYIILQSDKDGVTLQDLEHPLFTQQLTHSVFQKILQNAVKNAVKGNP